MKDFPVTLNKIANQSIVSNVKNTVHAEWNLNRYIADPAIEVSDSIPGTNQYDDTRSESEQIAKSFPIESAVKMGRGTLSGYVVNGTKYKTVPRYVDQRGRSDQSWQDDTTWLWYDANTRYQYWVSSLRASNTGALPHNVGRIVYDFGQSVNCNKIVIKFQRHHAFPSTWRVYIDTTGEDTWSLLVNNATVPSNGEFAIYRVFSGENFAVGEWGTSAVRWTPEQENHTKVFRIKIEMDTVDVSSGRPGIVEISPRLEADLSSLVVDWSATEELSDPDFISPIGKASANTGSITFSNDTGIFNEQDTNGPFFKMLDEEVQIRGFLEIDTEIIPTFNMLSDSWQTENMDNCSVQLVDYARVLQNTKCGDMVISNVTVGSAFHMLFASLGLPQFDIVQTGPKQTPTLEKFYTKREQSVWEVVQEVCESLQVGMLFDTSGNLRMFTKEALYDETSLTSYSFTSENVGSKKSDIFSLNRQENSRFNKVIVRYGAINDFSLSGSKNQKMWSAPEPWVIGAAQIVKNISEGDNAFWIDPNKPESLPRFSGTVTIEGLKNDYDWEGMQYFCKNSTESSKYIRVASNSDYWAAVEKNNGEAPRFTGKVFLKDDKTFNRDFTAKNFGFRQDWEMMEFQVPSSDGVRVTTGGKHSPSDGSLKITTSYAASKRLTVFRKTKQWNRFDRVGMKFKVKSNNARTGLVLWPQGRNGAAGYHFLVDPMSKSEISKIVSRKEKDGEAAKRPSPEITGFVIRDNGNRVDMPFDNAKDFKDISPVKVDSWSYLEVAVYEVTGGFEFEVFVDGRYCKTFTDKTVKLTRNEKAGMTFLGTGETMVDKFYVVNYPQSEIRGKDKDDSGWVVRRKDLWLDRKKSGGDKDFTRYLNMVEKRKRTQLFDYDFSGRFHAVAREKIKERVRFEEPALTAEMVVTNSAVDIVSFDPSSFGARFVLVNTSEKPQLLKGTKKTRNSGADRQMSSYIYGRSFRTAEIQEIEYKDNDLIDRMGELLIEFESKWIQSRAVANDLAKWVRARFGKNSEIYSIEVFGNPLIEVGDIVSMWWPEKGIVGDYSWVVSSVANSWQNGLQTTVVVRRIT